jgi:arginase
MSRLRARCPDCRTFTAVALGPGYECHACGREFGAGLVRVPRAWGEGGESMAQAARLPLPYPEASVVEEDSLGEQNLAIAMDLPERPLVLGGCCCAHVGAVEGLAARSGRLGLVWFDAHGDLNTPESSPSGNAWGMPLRMLVDAGDVDPRDVVLLGARSLDPPELDFIAASGIRRELGGLPEHVYVAVDCDVLDDLPVFMPEPGGMPVAELERVLAGLPVPAGAGFTGLVRSEAAAEALPRLGHALGL